MSEENKDPRKAETLGEAAMNPDGTYNGLKALSWLSEAMRPGKGIPEDEVAKIWKEAKAKAGRQQRANPTKE